MRTAPVCPGLWLENGQLKCDIMRVCMCILGGTEACKHCRNNSSYLNHIEDWNKDMEKRYSDKRRVVTYTVTR